MEVKSSMLLFFYMFMFSHVAKSEERAFSPKAHAIRYWFTQTNPEAPPPKFLLKKASPLSASDSARFARLAASHSLSSHLPSFCKLARLFCFPDPVPSSLGEQRVSDTFVANTSNKNFINYSAGGGRGTDSFKNYSAQQNEAVDSFRRYGGGSTDHREEFSSYASGDKFALETFKAYSRGSFGGGGSFASYSSNVNAGDQGFNGYGELGSRTSNTFKDYANNTNVLGSAFSHYSETGKRGSNAFKSYGSNANFPHNLFTSYEKGGKDGTSTFTTYREQSNNGTAAFRSYARNSDDEDVSFAAYGDASNGGGSNFTSYGIDSRGQGVQFRRYSPNDIDFKEYAKTGVSFTRYARTASHGRRPRAEGVDHEQGKFFRERELKEGNVMRMADIRDKLPPRSFLPRSILSKLPFSSSKISQLKGIFNASDNSSMEGILSSALHECERDPSLGETKRCVGSVEDMVDFAVSVLGRSVEARATRNVNGSGTDILIGKVRGVDGGKVTKAVSCHQSLYPYLLYYCHSVPKVRVYEAEILDPKSKARINRGVSICHLDTSAWGPTHGAFLALGHGPGEFEVCHWIFENDLTWTIAGNANKLQVS